MTGKIDSNDSILFRYWRLLRPRRFVARIAMDQEHGLRGGACRGVVNLQAIDTGSRKHKWNQQQTQEFHNNNLIWCSAFPGAVGVSVLDVFRVSRLSPRAARVVALLRGVDAEQRPVGFVGEQVEQAVGALADVADAVVEVAKDTFAVEFFPLVVEIDAL